MPYLQPIQFKCRNNSISTLFLTSLLWLPHQKYSTPCIYVQRWQPKKDNVRHMPLNICRTYFGQIFHDVAKLKDVWICKSTRWKIPVSLPSSWDVWPTYVRHITFLGFHLRYFWLNFVVEHIGLQSSLGGGKHVADRDNGDYTEYLYHQPIWQRQGRLQRMSLPSANLTVTRETEYLYNQPIWRRQRRLYRIPQPSANMTETR